MSDNFAFSRTIQKKIQNTYLADEVIGGKKLTFMGSDMLTSYYFN